MRDLDDDDHQDAMRRHSSTWRRLKMIKDRVRLSFKKSWSRNNQMEKRKRGKLNVEIRCDTDQVLKRADDCQGNEKRWLPEQEGGLDGEAGEEDADESQPNRLTVQVKARSKKASEMLVAPQISEW